MALPLLIPNYVRIPARPLRPPPLGKPGRIQIEGALVSIQERLPQAPWQVDVCEPIFPQPADPELAKLAYRAIYGQGFRPHVENDLDVRDEYLDWVDQKK
jgi:hypothetical protein